MKIEDFLKENLKLVDRQRLLHMASIKYPTHVVFLITGAGKGILNGKLKLFDRFIILCILSVILGIVFYMIKNLLLFFVVIINLKFPDVLNSKEQWIVSFILFYSVLVFISFIRIHILPNSAEKIYKHAYKTYKESAQQSFTEDEFKKAGTALKEFKPVSYEHAVQKYGDRIVDLLYICSALTYDKGKLKRMISLKALEEDREANAADDLEENSSLP